MRSARDDTEELIFDLEKRCISAMAKPHGHVTKARATARCGGPEICMHCFWEKIAPQVTRRADRLRAARAVADIRMFHMPSGGKMELRSDYDQHLVYLTTSDGRCHRFELGEMRNAVDHMRQAAAASALACREIEGPTHEALALNGGQPHFDPGATPQPGGNEDG